MSQTANITITDDVQLTYEQQSALITTLQQEIRSNALIQNLCCSYMDQEQGVDPCIPNTQTNTMTLLERLLDAVDTTPKTTTTKMHMIMSNGV